MNIILSLGNMHVEFGADGGYAPDVADDLHRHAVDTMKDLLAVAMAVGAYSAHTTTADEEDEQ